MDIVGNFWMTKSISDAVWNIGKDKKLKREIRDAARKEVLDKLVAWLDEREKKRLQDSKGRNEDHEFINELYAHRDIDLTFRKKIEELRDGDE